MIRKKKKQKTLASLLSLVVILIESDITLLIFSKFTTSVHLTTILSSIPNIYE